ncbi:glutaredoxin 2 [Bombina bombina]|uniref:glutaredoxin 2 n=1 Tax=Bombina bombina TaxID=8345 RepID=UPI00235ADC54|nr:glutaredoxin 2 [Bombina bombina]
MQFVLAVYSTVCREVLLQFKNLPNTFNASTSIKRMGNSSSTNSDALKMVEEAVSQNCVVIFSKTSCPYCKMAKDAFREINVDFKTVELDEEEHGSEMQAALHQLTGARTVPRVFVNGTCIGGGSETRKLNQDGKLLKLVQQCKLSARRS